MKPYIVGQTYTLTGDEPNWELDGSIRDFYVDAVFPKEVTLDSVDRDGDYRFADDNYYTYYVARSYGGPETVADADADMVNHPAHYNGHPAGIEAIDVIETNPFYNLAAAMKYLWRVSWGSKHNDIEDLQKAVWYIQREIGRRNGQV